MRDVGMRDVGMRDAGMRDAEDVVPYIYKKPPGLLRPGGFLA